MVIFKEVFIYNLSTDFLYMKMKSIKKILSFSFCLLLILLLLPINSQVSSNVNAINYAYGQIEWVEAQMQQMTPEQRIGQLLMVAAYSNKDEAHKNSIVQLIKTYNIGGLIFFQGTAQKQAQLTNHYQAYSKTPLLIAIDGEWGLNMRLKNTPKFPKQLTLGAVQNNQLIYDMGTEIARQCKRIGVHVNLAPVVDVNNNPKNPVINDRSFGENKYNVAAKGVAYMQGMEMNGILACAKHFPGHGDTDQDSHYTLPTITHDLNRLNDVELYPFKELVKYNVSSIMIAHLAIPALDNTPVKVGSQLSMPTTLSEKVVTDLLRKDMGYEGLIFTDALNMKGVSSHFAPGIVDVKALLAGNDILLFPENVDKAISEIKNAVNRGEISQAIIDEKVRKILRAKYRVGLHKQQAVDIANVNSDLNTANTQFLIQQLYENALTLAKNEAKQIPYKNLGGKQFASLALGRTSISPFQLSADKYASFKHHTLKYNDSKAAFQQKFAALKDADHVLISLHNMSKYAADYGVSDNSLDLIKQLQAVTQVSIVVFGSPYSLKYFNDAQTVLMAYEDVAMAQNLAAQVLFGGIAAKGKLPVTASAAYPYGQGSETVGGMRFKYTVPEEVGLNTRDLQAIDTIVNEAILDKAMPGCQVLVAKNGKVIFQKAYGKHTYGNSFKVSNNDLYDLASITKIAATSLGLMEMYDKGQLNLQGYLKEYIPELQGSNKAYLSPFSMLIHEAGLKSWIPFYESTIPYAVRKKVYNTRCDSVYCIPVADNMYLTAAYYDSIYNTIKSSELPNVGEYRYSDVGYYYFTQILERYAGTTLDQYVDKHFYQPLGLSNITYAPLEKFSKRSIVPSENDTKWRKQLVQGHVHDMGAAMMGGVAGHAGIFSNANDLGVLMQMLLNGGSYGGETFFKGATVKKFTTYQKKGSRRGLAFDKPEPDASKPQPTSTAASPKTFGHTGFTGTCAWADPEHDLVYVFLSNRTYPDMGNYKLIRTNVRTRIQDVIYEAIDKSKLIANQN